MVLKIYSFSLGILLCLSSCQESTPKQQSSAPVTLPNTPEEVAQQWIEAFYSDDFDKAVLLGTDITRMMIDSVKKEMEPNAALIAFKISNMSCQIQQDSAFCTCTYEEDMEQSEEFMSLLNVKGQWLVNESWDPVSTVEQEFDMLREEVERVLQEEALEQ